MLIYLTDKNVKGIKTDNKKRKNYYTVDHSLVFQPFVFIHIYLLYMQLVGTRYNM